MWLVGGAADESCAQGHSLADFYRRDAGLLLLGDVSREHVRNSAVELPISAGRGFRNWV